MDKNAPVSYAMYCSLIKVVESNGVLYYLPAKVG